MEECLSKYNDEQKWDTFFILMGKTIFYLFNFYLLGSNSVYYW